MTTVENRCPVTWRFITCLVERLEAMPMLYEEDVRVVKDLRTEAWHIGRSQSAQLQRGFYLLEHAVYVASANRSMRPFLLKLMQGGTIRSRERLADAVASVDEMVRSFRLDAAEARLAGEMTKIDGSFVYVKDVGNSLDREKASHVLSHMKNMATHLRSSLVEADITLGSVAIEYHKFADSVGTPLTQRISTATNLTRISEKGPVLPWMEMQGQ